MTVFTSRQRRTHLERLRRRERRQGWLVVLSLVLLLGMVGGMSAGGRGEVVENPRTAASSAVSE